MEGRRFWDWPQTRNTSWGCWITPIVWTKKFDHKDIRKAITIDWAPSIWSLDLSTKVLDILIKWLYRNLQDLKEVSPEWIPWISLATVNKIHNLLRFWNNQKYSPDWRPSKHANFH